MYKSFTENFSPNLMRKILPLVFGCLTIPLAAPSFAAGLEGDQIFCSYTVTGSGVPGTANFWDPAQPVGTSLYPNQPNPTVSSGPECGANFSGAFTVTGDISSSSFDVFMSNETDTDAGGWLLEIIFSDLDWSNSLGLESVFEDVAQNSFFPVATNLAYTRDSLIFRADFREPGSYAANSVFAASYLLQPENAQAVPTPALLPGLIGFGMSIVRKKRKQEVAA